MYWQIIATGWVVISLFTLGHCLSMYPKHSLGEALFASAIWPAYYGDELNRYQKKLYPYGDKIDRHHPEYAGE